MGSSLTIRAYAETDWPSICSIHDAARLQELAAGGVDLLAFRPMVEAADGDEFFVSETMVACIDDSVVGFVSWNGSYITWLYVAPLHQRLGIGRRLLGEAMTRIGPEAWTSLLAANEPALALYRSAGMKVVSTKSGDCDGYPAVGMRMALPTSRMRDPEAKRVK